MTPAPDLETNIPALIAHREQRRANMIQAAANILGAVPADGPIPGLWNVPGYPELTTGQLLQIAAERP